ncbi:unnamed protein product [Arabidopsis lyrata]|nr:unnamed protein product [Arabidopsis lyrata]
MLIKFDIYPKNLKKKAPPPRIETHYARRDAPGPFSSSASGRLEPPAPGMFAPPAAGPFAPPGPGPFYPPAPGPM